MRPSQRFCVQAYNFEGAFQASCDATKERGPVAIVFVGKAVHSEETMGAVDEDPLSLGGLNASLLSVHVYSHDIASIMVATGTNRFHGGTVVAAVPAVRLDVPENWQLFQATVCKVGRLPLRCGIVRLSC